jgi:hypothetical protein
MNNKILQIINRKELLQDNIQYSIKYLTIGMIIGILIHYIGTYIIKRNNKVK